MIETHVVLSWIWNADGTASIQALAYGDEITCNQFARTEPRQTDDPRELIVVCDAEAYRAKRDDPERLMGLN